MPVLHLECREKFEDPGGSLNTGTIKRSRKQDLLAFSKGTVDSENAVRYAVVQISWNSPLSKPTQLTYDYSA